MKVYVLMAEYSYLVTNYETSTFGVHQSKYVDGVNSNIVAIASTHTTLGHGLARRDKIGIGLGALLFLVICIVAAILCMRARTRARRKGSKDSTASTNGATDRKSAPLALATHEIGAGGHIGWYSELSGSGTPELASHMRSLDDKDLIAHRFAVLGLHELHKPSLQTAYELDDHRDSIKTSPDSIGFPHIVRAETDSTLDHEEP